MHYQKAYRMYRVLLLTGLGLLLLNALLGRILSEPVFHKFLFLDTAIALAGIAIGGKYCRCPFCRKPLDLRSKLPAYCPHCGKKLDSDR